MKSQRFSLTRKFDGKVYSIYPAKRYTSKREIESVLKSLRNQGYLARKVRRSGYYLIYIKKL